MSKAKLMASYVNIIKADNNFLRKRKILIFKSQWLFLKSLLQGFKTTNLVTKPYELFHKKLHKFLHN